VSVSEIQVKALSLYMCCFQHSEDGRHNNTVNPWIFDLLDLSVG